MQLMTIFCADRRIKSSVYLCRIMQTVTGKNIETARLLLEQGKLVAIPTETVYGLAANAINPDAVIKIFEAKNRPQFNPLIVHLKSWDDLEKYVQDIPAKAHLLAKHFVPGPLTFLLPRKPVIPDIVTAGSDLVAIRIPDHPVTLSLLKKLNFPLAAPSANEFGYISPTLAAHVLDSLEGKIEYILDGGAAGIGLESTIIGFDEQEQIVLHRAGGIPVEAIEAVTGEKVLIATKSIRKTPQAPGQLKSHYAPYAALYIGDIPVLAQQFQGKKIASINFFQFYQGIKDINQFILSTDQNLAEAATKLFRIMREIDKLGVDIILTEIFPDEGLGKAINDRLQRAQVLYK